MQRLSLLFVAAMAASLPALAEDKKPTSRVEGTFVIPKEVRSFEGRVVEIRLYRYDPRIADKAADLVDKVELKNFSHAKDKETRKKFVLGDKAELHEKQGYYVTLFVLDGKERTHIGEGEHAKNNLCKVLTYGQPNVIVVNVREVRKK